MVEVAGTIAGPELDAPQRPVQVVLRVAVLLTAFIGLTSAAFLLLTLGSLRSTHVDLALADMNELLGNLEPRLLERSAELPIRLLSEPSQASVLPDGPLPRSYREFLGDTSVASLPTLDPWGYSYMLVVRKHGARVLLSCLSPGPNGLFETAPEDHAANSDDLRVQRAIHATQD